jgi:hypothetical protein
LERLSGPGGVPEVLLDGQRRPSDFLIVGDQVYVANMGVTSEAGYEDPDPDGFPAIIVATLPP